MRLLLWMVVCVCVHVWCRVALRLVHSHAHFAFIPSTPPPLLPSPPLPLSSSPLLPCLIPIPNPPPSRAPRQHDLARLDDVEVPLAELRADLDLSHDRRAHEVRDRALDELDGDDVAGRALVAEPRVAGGAGAEEVLDVVGLGEAACCLSWWRWR